MLPFEHSKGLPNPPTTQPHLLLLFFSLNFPFSFCNFPTWPAKHFPSNWFDTKNPGQDLFSVYNTDSPRFDQISGTTFVFILILTKGQNNLCSCLNIHDFISDLWAKPSGSLEVYWGPHVAEIGMILRFWEDILCVPRTYQPKTIIHNFKNNVIPWLNVPSFMNRLAKKTQSIALPVPAQIYVICKLSLFQIQSGPSKKCPERKCLDWWFLFL